MRILSSFFVILTNTAATISAHLCLSRQQTAQIGFACRLLVIQAAFDDIERYLGAPNDQS